MEIIRVGYTDNGRMIQKEWGMSYGYGVEYLQMIAMYTGWQYEYVEVTEENRIQALESGQIDLLCDVSEEEGEGKYILLSEATSGLSYTLLCAKEDDTSVFFEDYEAFDGMRVAINNTKYMESLLKEFAAFHGIEYTPVYCESFAGLKQAIEEDRADLMLASNQRKLDGYKYVAKVGVEEQFFAVTASKPELKEKLDFADGQIKLNQPFLMADLYEKYYERPMLELTGVTREEYEFMKNKGSVRVVCDANGYPVEYIDPETGEYSGVYADAMKLLSEYSGLTFEFAPQEDFRSAWDLLSKGEADMSAGVFINPVLAQQHGISYSDYYMDADYTMVGRENTVLPDNAVIALPAEFIGVHEFIREQYPHWQLVFGDSQAECLRMVERRQADATLIESIYLQTAYNLHDYKDISILPTFDIKIPMCCGLGGKDAKIIKQILNKAIARIPEEKFERCVKENAIKLSYEMTPGDMFKEFLPFLVMVVVLLASGFIAFISERERRYRHLAMTDSVTGLWNGMKFRQEAEALLENNKQKEYELISFDVERFKYVNNDFGEKAADEVLKMLGNRTHRMFGHDALYARDMADMFLILTERRDDLPEIFRHFSDEIIFETNGVEQVYEPTIKFGICRIAGEKRPLSEYIDRAIMARKSVKGDGVKDSAYYDAEMEAKVSDEHKIEKRQEEALKNKEFLVYYQPKYDLKTETVVGAEALVRWNDPEEGIISPGRFIPVFERNGFIVQLDFYVYEEVLKAMAQWQKEGRIPIIVSVNVSRVHISTAGFLKRLLDLTRRYEIPGGMLELELTETVLGGNQRDVREFIWKCKRAGFQVSIDDFGSGYSSLNC